jgi:hypothetical protein
MITSLRFVDRHTDALSVYTIQKHWLIMNSRIRSHIGNVGTPLRMDALYDIVRLIYRPINDLVSVQPYQLQR